MKHVLLELGLKGVPEPAMRLVRGVLSAVLLLVEQLVLLILANLTSSGVCWLSLSSQSRSCEIYPKSDRTMVRGVAGQYSAARRGGVVVVVFDHIFLLVK